MLRQIGLGLAAVGLIAAAQPASAEWPNDKPITFVIPYSPGGGFDTIVRAFAPALEKILGAEVVPENIPGAGGAKGAQTVHRAEPDGYTIGIYNIPGFTVTQVLGQDLGFDLAEVTWLANLATDRYAIAVKADSEIDTLGELCGQGRDVKMSDTGASSTASVSTRVSFSLIDCPLVDVNGYEGSNDAMIAVMRGEVDGTLKPISSLQKYVESGDMKYIVTYTEKGVIDGVESTGELGHADLAKLDVRRVIGGPPGLPEDIRQRLSDAFLEAAKMPEVQEWAAGAGVELEVVGGQETAAMMSDLATFYANYKDVLQQQ
jgi:tripartite-type tricarboxylate transporter receptor subunit TctC